MAVKDPVPSMVEVFSKSRSLKDWKNLTPVQRTQATKQEECIVSAMFAIGVTPFAYQGLSAWAAKSLFGNVAVVGIMDALDQQSLPSTLIGGLVNNAIGPAVDGIESYTNDCICAFK